MTDFKSYSELYHYGVKGMHWGIRRYQNSDGTLTPEGKVKKSLGEKANDAVDKLMSIDNDLANKLLRTSANIRKEYSRRGKMKTKEEQAASAKRAKKFSDQYLEKYGKEPLNYEQFNNAKKGAIAGAVVGVVVPVILPLWATIPAGYYIGSKVKHNDEFSEVLCHYGVKGMKWHKHLFLREDDDDDDDETIKERIESEDFKKKEAILYDYYDKGDYKSLANWYIHDLEAKKMIDSIVAPAIRDKLEEMKPGSGKKFNKFRLQLNKKIESEFYPEWRGTYDEVENGEKRTERKIGSYYDWHPDEKKKYLGPKNPKTGKRSTRGRYKKD